jgi:anti-sigma factor RsiW
MRCEEAQQHQALDITDSAVRAALLAHVAGCDACRSTGLLFAKIDETLGAAPVWIAPRSFASRVAASGAPAAAELPESYLSSRSLLVAVAMGLLTCAAVWIAGLTTTTYDQWAVDLSRALVANSNSVAWTSMVFALGISAWFTRRALR